MEQVESPGLPTPQTGKPPYFKVAMVAACVSAVVSTGIVSFAITTGAVWFLRIALGEVSP